MLEGLQYRAWNEKTLAPAAWGEEPGGARRALAVPQCIVGMTKLAPSLMPEGHRAVTVLVLV